MHNPHRLGVIAVVFAIVTTVFPVRSFAQIDLSGEWAARLHEDRPHRFEGPSIGDYTGLPLNEAARQKADSWDASIQSLREHQLQPLTAIYGSHGIANLRIAKIVDDATQQVVAYKIFRSPGTGGIRMIWMDGRSHPPEYAAHTSMGFSTGTWEGGMLTVETSHVKTGTIQRNGVPHSDRATMTERLVRHGSYLTVIGTITDPVYLDEPLVRSWNYAIDLGQQLEPVPGEIVDEIAGLTRGNVPHHLPGTNPFLQEFAQQVGLPFEVTRGGRETTYPEYQLTLQALLSKMPTGPGSRPR